MSGLTETTATYKFSIPICMATQISVIADSEEAALAIMERMERSGALRAIVQSHIENGLLDFSLDTYELEEVIPCNMNCQADICRHPA